MTHTGSFRDLKVWQNSMTLVEEVYTVTSKFPSDERFGLTAQVRRASVSIPSNIGEGKRRKRQRAYLHHLDIALGFHQEARFRSHFTARRRSGPYAERPDRVAPASRQGLVARTC
jgi:four helix bundle protein